MQPVRAHARVLVASVMGTTVEYFDFFIYATAAALFFGPLFFPTASPAAQTLLAFVSFGVAFIARPFGAIVFGHFGDRVGRKATLVASLMTMGVSTVAIAFVPTYAVAGWIAPALLCLLRFGQGLGLGGEWTGAALLAIENAPEGWRARYGATPQLGVPLGYLCANGLFLLLGQVLSPAQFAAWGWRLPFLASAVLVGLGLWVRLRIEETPEFSAALAIAHPPKTPLLQVLSEHFPRVLAGSAGAIATYGLFYIATAYALAEGTGSLGYARGSFLEVQLLANVFLAVGIVAAAHVADRRGARWTLGCGAVVTVLAGLVFTPALHSGSLALVAAMLCAVMFGMGFNAAPLAAWLSQLFPVRVRYTGVAFAFNVGGIVGGAVTPIAAQMLNAAGASRYVGLLLLGVGLASLAGVVAGRPVEEA
jgi:MFS family permease